VQELLFIIAIDGKAMHFNFLIEKEHSGFILKGFGNEMVFPFMELHLLLANG
jgi:hypothetical protein